MTLEIIDPEMRILIRGDAAVLQQKWRIKEIADRKIVSERAEWRDVPTIRGDA